MAKGIKTGGGSRKGKPNKASVAKAQAIAASGLTPLDFLMGVMRNNTLELSMRIDAGKAAAPYVHPKLANIELTGKDGGPVGVRVVRYSDPTAQQLGTAGLPNALVDVAGTGMPSRRPRESPAQR